MYICPRCETITTSGSFGAVLPSTLSVRGVTFSTVQGALRVRPGSGSDEGGRGIASKFMPGWFRMSRRHFAFGGALVKGRRGRKVVVSCRVSLCEVSWVRCDGLGSQGGPLVGGGGDKNIPVCDTGRSAGRSHGSLNCFQGVAAAGTLCGCCVPVLAIVR